MGGTHGQSTQDKREKPDQSKDKNQTEIARPQASGKKTARKSKARKARARKSATRRRRKQEGVVDTLADGAETVQKSFEDSAKMQERIGTRWGTGEG